MEQGVARMEHLIPNNCVCKVFPDSITVLRTCFKSGRACYGNMCFSPCRPNVEHLVPCVFPILNTSFLLQICFTSGNHCSKTWLTSGVHCPKCVPNSEHVDPSKYITFIKNRPSSEDKLVPNHVVPRNTCFQGVPSQERLAETMRPHLERVAPNIFFDVCEIVQKNPDRFQN